MNALATLRDIAREAKVSVATVSRVLNGDGGRRVRPESEAAVRAAARKLGYQPNRAARSLRLQQTEMLGIVVPHIANPFFATVVQAVERALQSTRWDLLIGDAQEDPDLEFRRLQSLAARQVDGVIVVPCEGERSAKALSSLGSIPLVQVDRRVDRLETDWVGVHHRIGIEAAVRHLRGVGRTRLCFVGAQGSSPAATQRLTGYQRALDDDPVSAGRYYLGDFSLEWGHRAGLELLDDGPLPDAVVCGNDLIALGVMRTLRDAGVRIPDDVALTGFDDIEFAGLAEPPLTTIRQPVEQIGLLAVDLLQQRIKQPDMPCREVRLAPEVIIRGTTGAQPAGATNDER